MRQKKSKKMLYILVLAAFIFVGYLVSRDMAVKTEHVEEVIPNNFLKR